MIGVSVIGIVILLALVGGLAALVIYLIGRGKS